MLLIFIVYINLCSDLHHLNELCPSGSPAKAPLPLALVALERQRGQSCPQGPGRKEGWLRLQKEPKSGRDPRDPKEQGHLLTLVFFCFLVVGFGVDELEHVSTISMSGNQLALNLWGHPKLDS